MHKSFKIKMFVLKIKNIFINRKEPLVIISAKNLTILLIKRLDKGKE